MCPGFAKSLEKVAPFDELRLEFASSLVCFRVGMEIVSFPLFVEVYSAIQ